MLADQEAEREREIAAAEAVAESMAALGLADQALDVGEGDEV